MIFAKLGTVYSSLIVIVEFNFYEFMPIVSVSIKIK